ncbi:hypothetical protein [Actinoplanes subglobosus]|uniref:Uncharacterized protein n=1 Tax=Actinoplanes subglobosus TaxID=1547892 RepID=A0ABV8J689_9ACTN
MNRPLAAFVMGAALLTGPAAPAAATTDPIAGSVGGPGTTVVEATVITPAAR